MIWVIDILMHCNTLSWFVAYDSFTVHTFALNFLIVANNWLRCSVHNCLQFACSQPFFFWCRVIDMHAQMAKNYFHSNTLNACFFLHSFALAFARIQCTLHHTMQHIFEKNLTIANNDKKMRAAHKKLILCAKSNSIIEIVEHI